MTRWRRFFALDAAQRRVFLASLVLLPCTSVLLRLRGYAAAQRFIGRVPELAIGAVAPEAAARMVDAAAALVGATCVPRSLVLWRLMRFRGAIVRFGVARAAPEFEAHAWVELDGEPLNDRLDVTARYAALHRAGGLRS